MKRARLSFVLLAVLTLTAAVGRGAIPQPPIGPPILPPSSPAPAQIGRLDAAHAILRFSGAVGNPTPLPLVNDPIPPVCATFCREFAFAAGTTAPFLVSIHGTVPGPNGTFNANDGFDLYLYGPDRGLLASGNGIGADGQAVEVRAPAKGVYTILVTFTYAEDANAAYVGEVRMMSGLSWRPATCTTTVIGGVRGCFELPVLRALPAYDLTVTGLPPAASTPLGFPFPVSAATPTSCYADETLGLDDPSPDQLQHPTTRCLRFTSDVRNIGAGGLVVRLPWFTSSGTSGFAPGGCNAQQVVTTTRGVSAVRPAGPCEFHPMHGHFHYRDLVSFTLYRPSASGGIGPAVGSSLKESFCLGDDEYFGFGSAGPNGARGFVGQPGCNVPADTSADGAYVVEGVSPGWGDVYTWDTPDQFINITNMAAGTYYLVEKTNPDGSLLVAGPQKTCSLTKLVLTASSVKMLSTQASIACPA